MTSTQDLATTTGLGGRYACSECYMSSNEMPEEREWAHQCWAKSKDGKPLWACESHIIDRGKSLTVREMYDLIGRQLDECGDAVVQILWFNLRTQQFENEDVVSISFDGEGAATIVGRSAR